MRVEVSVHEGDALRYRADVLVTKHAQALYGLDEMVYFRLAESGRSPEELRPANGSFVVHESNGAVGARLVLILGTVPLGAFRYQEVRQFSRRALAALADRAPDVSTMALTLHGANYGLDEVEAFEAEVAGLLDGITSGQAPRGLTSITFVENNQRRARRLQKMLSSLVPDGHFETSLRDHLDTLSLSAGEKLRSVGYASESKPLIFVAMPFSEEMEDVWEFGIQGAAHEAGFLCERADTCAFTGDILDRVKQRIRSARLLVADLSGANQNVYLELGFAWGCGTPTVLVTDEETPLKFDVQGQRCLVYSTIGTLRKKLLRELNSLRPTIDGGGPDIAGR